MKPPDPQVCTFCGEPAHEPGRTLPLCDPCELAYQESPEQTEVATARSRFIQRRRAERQAPAAVAPPKLTSGDVRAWGQAAPTKGGYRPPDPESEGT